MSPSKKDAMIAAITQVKPSEAAIAIKHIVNVNLRNARLGKKRRSLMLWGGPGIAKSAIAAMVARQLNFKLIDIRGSQLEPTDVRGIPIPVEHYGTTEVVWATPATFPKRDPGKRTATIPMDYVDLTIEQMEAVDAIVNPYIEEEFELQSGYLMSQQYPLFAQMGPELQEKARARVRKKFMNAINFDRTIDVARFEAIRDLGFNYQGAIMLLDELPNAPGAVQAAFYQLTLDGQLGEWFVPDNVVVMAAGNRETDKASTFKMPTPLLNRFIHLDMKEDFSDWQTHAMLEGYDKDVVGYVTQFKGELNMFDPASASRGFATPRTWEVTSDLIADNPNLPRDVLQAMIAGTIGDGIAVKFMEYRRNAATLPKAEDILDGRVKNLDKVGPERIGLTYSLATSLGYELNARYKEVRTSKDVKAAKREFAKSCDNFLGFMMDNFQEEMTIMGARLALSVYNIGFDPTLLTHWNRFSDNYQDLILEA